MKLGVVRDDPFSPPKTGGCISRVAYYAAALVAVGLLVAVASTFIGGVIYLVHFIWAPIIKGKL